MIAHLGCGYWGKNIVSTLHKHNLLGGIYDFDPRLNSDFCRKYSLHERTINELLDDPCIFACSVATPANSHYELSKLILNAGKHLFVEKPICLSLQEANHLKEIANDHSLKIMVGHLMHYHAGFMKMKEILNSLQLGKVKRIKSYRKSYGILRDDEDVIWSFAPHDISMAFAITSSFNFNNLSVSRKKFFNNNTDSANIFFTSNSIPVEIDLDWSSSYKQQRFEVYCEDGIVILDDTLENDKKLAIIKTKFNQSCLRAKNILQQDYIHCDYSLLPLEAELLKFNEISITDSSDCYNNVNEAIAVLSVLKKVEFYD